MERLHPDRELRLANPSNGRLVIAAADRPSFGLPAMGLIFIAIGVRAGLKRRRVAQN